MKCSDPPLHLKLPQPSLLLAGSFLCQLEIFTFNEIWPTGLFTGRLTDCIELIAVVVVVLGFALVCISFSFSSLLLSLIFFLVIIIIIIIHF